MIINGKEGIIFLTLESAYYFFIVFLSFKTISCWATITANQCSASTTHAGYYSVYSLLWKVSPLLCKGPTQALKGVTRPNAPIYDLRKAAAVFPSWSHKASIGFISGEWDCQGSILSMLRSSKNRQLGFDEDVRYRSWRWCSDASPRMSQQRVGERHWCTVPHSSLSSTCMVTSFDDLTMGDLWRYQSVASKQLWYCCCGHMKQFSNSSHWSSRFQVPNQAQSCSFNQFCLSFKEKALV